MSKTQPARGMRDFLPADVRKRNYVINIIREVYESYGFEPLETPAVENLETLTGKYGEEGNQLMFRILKRGEKLDLDAGEKGLSDLALRYDLTVPLARVVANYRERLPRFFKRYQIQPVWRADRPARGRFREFYQCDVDAIGSNSMIVEAELIGAVSEILERLGFKDFVIKVNHRRLLTGILELFEIPSEKHTDTLISLDKLDKIGRDGVFNELLTRGVAELNAEKLLDFLEKMHAYSSQKKDSISANLHNLRILLGVAEVIGVNENTDIAVGELHKLGDLLEGLTIDQKVKLDASLARGLSYYTGAIFEINVPDLAGSLGGGGRYDGLIGMFGKEQIPACGFSLGLERILVVMDERGMFPAELTESAADVLVTIMDENSAGESLKLANELRAGGLRVLVYPEADKLGKQFKYAGQINVSFVCVLGETELAENKVTLKNMQTGEQQTVSRADAAAKIAERR
jgi:histidyl-tRNA synthetase